VTLLERVIVVNAVLLQSFYSVQKNSTTLLMPDGLTPITFGIRFKQMYAVISNRNTGILLCVVFLL
jgi:hypothetical protein